MNRFLQFSSSLIRRPVFARKTYSKWLWGLTGVSVATGGSFLYCYVNHAAYDKIWFKGSYPSEIRELLKTAIWNESNKANFNYGEALKVYIKILNRLDEKQYNKLIDHYTRIELKIADLLEKLDLVEDARNIYTELLYRYFNALNTPGNVPEPYRSEMIRKDLRLLIKSLELNRDLDLGKRNLLAHLLLVQEEILCKSPELKEFFDKRKERTSKRLMKASNDNEIGVDDEDFKTFVNSDNILMEQDGSMILDLQKKSSAWEPFKEEFFTARDLYTAYCLSSKDISSALSCKMTTVEWMVMADMPPGQILLAQANLGSLLYLEAEKFESDLSQIKSRCELDPALKQDDKIIKALRFLNSNKVKCLKMANQCYDSVIDFSKKNKRLRFHMDDQLDTAVSQAVALSIYGKGILDLHGGSLLKAERYLMDSIKLAKEINFAELLKEAEDELDKTRALKLKEVDDIDKLN
ncbi:hypothetical protein KAFR_0A00520 [Kazachstania africana CBS 2517]|uniref:Mitochondrial inner membrane i-AAA protease supercomplex subunit MGR3 n=1 Tax=Kazachstania africana (strain ATCC 22294 / BCRC 22015 / CBS 2517 / CECT 1963 / NBRC 1671 / NRRL Y-8276) TaxID=1071382 RepID=H2AM90_KAZAF|nr:hypothetical protein KAFR_0A00520 [Kazachstania africana CBS 2517]CCF55490.1 hypothetical protein KAFR_0A00520 [Kazachstania africana CBS 2517]